MKVDVIILMLTTVFFIEKRDSTVVAEMKKQ